jgi:hypothetical protein
MLRETEEFFPTATGDEGAEKFTSPSGCEGKKSVNFVKYEGKTENAPEENSFRRAYFAWEISGLIDESRDIIFFLRKSSSELSTSY